MAVHMTHDFMELQDALRLHESLPNKGTDMRQKERYKDKQTVKWVIAQPKAKNISTIKTIYF